jgi:hypothetical protein
MSFIPKCDMTSLIGIVNGIDAIGKVTWGDCRWSLSQCTRRRATGGGSEWKPPETGAYTLSPSFEDAASCGIDDLHVIFGENNFAALVGKWAQADEGMGK